MFLNQMPRFEPLSEEARFAALGRAADVRRGSHMRIGSREPRPGVLAVRLDRVAALR